MFLLTGILWLPNKSELRVTAPLRHDSPEAAHLHVTTGASRILLCLKEMKVCIVPFFA